MNSSTVLKKTLPLLVILLAIIGIAVTCTALKKEKNNPVIESGNEVYLSAGEGDFKYNITKGQMYDELKTNVGLSSLIIKVNKDILKAEGYYDKVTLEEINAEIEKEMFPDGKEDLTAEEIEEAKVEFEKDKFSSAGLKNEEEIQDYYRLVLAKKAYAKAKLDEEIAKKDSEAKENSDKYFPDSKYTTYYNSNYQQEFWAIVVPFATEKQATNALAQLGIEIHKKDATVTGDYDHWVWKESQEKLTAPQVVEAMINLYNTVYAYKLENYPTERIVLNEGKQYTKDEFGNFIFNTELSETDEALNTLHYTYKELSDYQTGILNSMRNNWVAYNSNSTTDANAKWYTPTIQSYNDGALHCLCLKIAEQSPKDLEDVKDEITEALINKTLTATYIETKMAELRASKNFTIYDTTLEKNYISSMTSYKVEHKATKVEKTNVIASIEGKEYTTEEFFNFMDESYGVSIALSLLNFERFMTNTDHNKYYDYKAEIAEKEKWLDASKYKEMKEQIANEKLVFTSGNYASYGYSPATMTWLEFIKAIYGADSENDLLVQYLYSDIISDYQNSLKDLSEATEDSDLWKFYTKHMEEIQKQYFKVEGVHLLISVYNDPKDITNSRSTPLDPKEWSEEQVKLAKELAAAVRKFIEDEEGTIKEKLTKVSDAFKSCMRYLPTLEQTVEAQPKVEGAEYTLKNIEVAKYLSAGISVKYQDLGEFENGKMVAEFDAAVKEIWDENPTSEATVVYQKDIQTVFGFHVYANLKSTDIAKWTDESGNTGILPTLEMIQKHLKDSNDETLTTEMKAAITKYHNPIATELGGTNNSYILQYKAMKDFNIKLEKANYELSDLEKAMDLAIESWYENIKYNK